MCFHTLVYKFKGPKRLLLIWWLRLVLLSFLGEPVGNFTLSYHKSEPSQGQERERLKPKGSGL